DAAHDVRSPGDPELIPRGGRVLAELPVPSEALFVLPPRRVNVAEHERRIAEEEPLMLAESELCPFPKVPEAPIELAPPLKRAAEEDQRLGKEPRIADLLGQPERLLGVGRRLADLAVARGEDVHPVRQGDGLGAADPRAPWRSPTPARCTRSPGRSGVR